MLFGRVSRILVDIVGTLIVLLLVGAGLLSWRLSTGPLSLKFLTPLIERALSDASGSVTVKDTVLAWTGWRHNVEIQVRGVAVRGPDGRLTLDVPEMAVGLSPRALLLHGLIAPTSLDAIGVQLVLVRSADGRWRFRGPAEAGEPTPSAVPRLLDELLAPPNPDSSLGYLVRASVQDSTIIARDEASGRTFTASDAQASVRRDEDGLRAQLSAVVDLAGRQADLSAAGHYHAAAGTLDMAAHFAKLDPAALGKAVPELRALSGFNVPLSGRIDLSFDPQFRLAQAAFDAAGEGGTLGAAAYDLPEDATVRHLRVRGRMPDGLRAIDVDQAEIDLGGPTVGFTGNASGLDAAPRAAGTVVLRNVTADDLRRLWPLSLAPHAREWITQNIIRATIGEAKVEIAATAPAVAGPWVVDQTNGTFGVSGAEVNYLTPMPHLQNVSGEGKVTKSRIDIATTGGHVGDLRLGRASVDLTQLDTNDETAELDVPISGPLRDALNLIDGPPFGYLKKIGRTPAEFSGDMAVRLQLKLPMKKDLKTEEIGLLATAHVQHLTQTQAALGRDVTDGDVDLRIDKDGLDLTGRVRLGAIPADVELRRNFSAQAAIVGRTRARARIASAADFAGLGFDVSSYVDGPTQVAVDYVERRGGRSDVTVDATLNDAAMTIDELDWRKPVGTPAAAHAVVALAGGRATAVTGFSLVSGDPASDGISVRGRAAFAPDGRTVARVDVDTLKAGLTDVHGFVDRSGGGLTIDIAGRTFNLGPFLKRDTTPAGPNRPPLSLDVKVDRLYFDKDRWLSQFHFRGRRGRDRWDTADLASDTIDEANRPRQANLTLQKFDDGRQTLDAVVEDAGAFLNDVGVTSNVIGGRLDIHGATDATRPGEPVVGHLHMTSYRVVRAPILARVLSVALLTGVLDSLTGRGIRFAQLDSDFAYFGPRIVVTNARSAGSAIGITASGTLDIENDAIDLTGTIVPANALNSLPAKIPLIGNILTGGGGGIFAATYQVKGPMSDPKVSVNPLSTLAPGFLRNLFGTLPGTSPTDSTPESEKEIERRQPPEPAPKPATPP